RPLLRRRPPPSPLIPYTTLFRSVALGTGIEPAHPGRRLVRINGGAAAATALGDWLAVLWLTPAMDRLFVETAGNRRRFLDRLVLNRKSTRLNSSHVKISYAVFCL